MNQVLVPDSSKFEKKSKSKAESLKLIFCTDDSLV